MAHLVGRKLRHRLLYKERRKGWNNNGGREDIIRISDDKFTARARVCVCVCVFYMSRHKSKLVCVCRCLRSILISSSGCAVRGSACQWLLWIYHPVQSPSQTVETFQHKRRKIQQISNEGRKWRRSQVMSFRSILGVEDKLLSTVIAAYNTYLKINFNFDHIRAGLH
jgi:hypothetical protein